MVILYKLENNRLIESPSNIVIGNGAILNPSEQQLRSAGYKDLIELTPPEIEWYEKLVCNYTEDDNSIFENWSVHPLEGLKELYKTKSNAKCDYTIAYGFVYIDDLGVHHRVRATETDQWNYFNSKEPFPCEIKLFEDDYYVFQTQTELDRFRIELENHILTALKTVCWQEKKAIYGLDNQEIYELLRLSNPF